MCVCVCYLNVCMEWWGGWLIITVTYPNSLGPEYVLISEVFRLTEAPFSFNRTDR